MKKILLPILLAAFLAKGWYHLTDGFAIRKVAPSGLVNYKWEPDRLSDSDGREAAKELLQQKFTYLARGQQSYVFASEDGKYVLKLFRLHKEKAPFWSYLPFCSKEVQGERLSKKRKSDKSYLLAKKYLKDMSGLIYLHLDKSSDMQQTIQIIDPIGRTFSLEADHMHFLLQKRVEPITEALARKKDHPQAMRQLIDALISSVSERASKNIRNKNRRCMKNLGLDHGRVIEYDLGEFRFKESLSEKENFKEEIIKSTAGFRKWLALNSPESLDYFDRKLDEI